MPIDMFLIASWVGGVAFALSGFVVGVRRDLDIMGVFILAFLTANGGGLLRDALIGRLPWALTDISAFIVVVVSFVAGLGLYRFYRDDLEKKGLFVVSDSVGLVAFSVTGALAGLDAGLNVFGVAVLAFITAAGGGVLRDMLVNDVPSVLRSDFYGSVALLVAVVIYGLDYFGVQGDMVIAVVFAGALLLRLLAYKMGWHLPKLRF